MMYVERVSETSTEASVPLKRLKILADENTRSVRLAITSLKLIHETDINDIFASHFPLFEV